MAQAAQAQLKLLASCSITSVTNTVPYGSGRQPGYTAERNALPPSKRQRKVKRINDFAVVGRMRMDYGINRQSA
jgi:hypothetical protein